MIFVTVEMHSQRMCDSGNAQPENACSVEYIHQGKFIATIAKKLRRPS
jgi:hypothetical protein